MNLTPKQELYVNARLDGKSQREAHHIAYPRSKVWKDSSVDSQACRLEKIPKVRARLSELIAEAAKRVVVTREWIIEQHLDSIARLNEALDREKKDDALPAQYVREKSNVLSELSKLTRAYDAPDESLGKVVIVDDL